MEFTGLKREQVNLQDDRSANGIAGTKPAKRADPRAAHTILPVRNLDVLRACAVLGVLTQHLSYSQQLEGFEWLGRAGVLVFFVHTAVVLMASLERERSEPGWVRAFYIRRIFRIYPLAWLVIALVLFLGVPSGSSVRGVVEPFQVLSWSEITANVLLMQNIAGSRLVQIVFWTLPLEVQMYIALPAVFLLARSGVRWMVIAVVISFVVGIWWELERAQMHGLWRFTILAFVPCFFAGALAYAGLRHRRRISLPAALWLPLLIALGLSYSPFNMRAKVYSAQPSQWVFCLAVALGIVFVRELSNSWLTRAAHVIATYSYGIYLLHPVVIWLAFVSLRAQPIEIQWLAFVAGLPLSAWIAFHAIERPGIRLGRSLAHSLRRRSDREFVEDPTLGNVAP